MVIMPESYHIFRKLRNLKFVYGFFLGFFLFYLSEITKKLFFSKDKTVSQRRISLLTPGKAQQLPSDLSYRHDFYMNENERK